MENDTSTIISAGVPNQDYLKANWIAEEKGQTEISADNQCLNLPSELKSSSVIELSDDEKIDIVAARILKRFRPAFEELAK